MHEDEKNKMLRLMRFWLFGTFVIIFAAATIYTGGALQLGLEIMKQPNYWYAMGIAAALCVAAYYAYRMYLNRNQ